jgi:hypothetical protein
MEEGHMSIPRRFAAGVWTYDGAIIERLDGATSWTLWHPEQPIDPQRWIDGCDVHGVVIQDGFATVDDAAAHHDKLSSVDCARCKRTKVFKAALKLAESTSNPPGEVDAELERRGG